MYSGGRGRSVEVFGAVTDEARRCLDMTTAGLAVRGCGEITLSRPPIRVTREMARARARRGRQPRIGRARRWPPARLDDYENATGPIAARVRDLGVRGAVG